MKRTLIPILFMLASPAMGQAAIEGKALALDGDTILVTPATGSSVRVRLWGVDAPEMTVWPWGIRSRGALDEIIRENGPYVRCDVRGKSHKRPVAECDSAKSPDGPFSFGIGRAMIRSGFAAEYRTYTEGMYADDEQQARDEKLGVWRDWAVK